MEAFLNLDYSIFSAINSLAGQNQILDYLAIFCAKYLIWIILSAGIGWWMGLHKTRTSKNWPLEGKKKWLIFGNLALPVVVAMFINQVLGFIKFRERPLVNLQINKLINRPLTEKSFPSDHTTIVFALSMAIFFYNKKLGSLLLFLSLLVGLSRIYTGVHYPLDVYGGAIVGILTSIIFYLILKPKKKL